MFRRYRQASLLKKTTLLSIGVLLVPCLLLSTVLFQFELRRQVDQEIKRNETVLRAMAVDIRNQMTYVESVVALMAESPEIRGLFTSPPESYGELVISLLYDVGMAVEENTAYLRDADASIMLIPLDDSIPEIYGSIMRHESMLADADYARFVSGDSFAMWGNMGFFMPPGKLNANYYNSRKIPYYKSVNAAFLQRLGTIKCSISAVRLFQSLIPWEESSALRVYQGDTCIWSVGNADLDMPEAIAKTTWWEGQMLYLPVEIEQVQLCLVMAMDGETLWRHAWLSILPIAALVLQTLALIIVITRLLLRSILGRLQTTAEAMGRLDEGCTRIQLPVGNPDELGMLVISFNKLLTRIDSQYEEIMEKELGRQHAQVLALQYQMNPHFLFNSLHWLQLQAEMGAPGKALSDAISLLGDILHYSLSSHPYATAGMEIAHIEGYISFVRLWKRIQIILTVRCDEEIKGNIIPRFALQPLVENAVWHGAVPGETLSIEVEIRQLEGLMQVTVLNDGKPIEASQLADMRRRVARNGNVQAEQGVGLSNLACRLYLLYGEDASVAIDLLDEKPRITLRFPVQEEEAIRAWTS